MRIPIVIFVGLSAWLAGVLATEPLGQAFTYQGRLTNNGQPYNGSANLRFRMYDQAPGGTLVGTSQTLSGVPVTNGLFAVVLNTNGQFGPNPFNGEKRWLRIDVNGNTLPDNQELTPAPYAVYATSA